MHIALVAGETSGDQLGAGLIESLKQRLPNAVFSGIGGPLMKQVGMTCYHDMEDISMMGLDGLFTDLPRIIKIRRQLYRHFSQDKPDVFIAIDVPDFNLGLELKLQKLGVSCVHYVSPTVWAWRGYRINKIKQAVSHMLVLFPFEVDYYQQHKIPVTFVGHPIAQKIANVPDKSSAKEQLQLPSQARIIALLPGSRTAEVARHAKLFLQTAQRLSRDDKDLIFVLSAANPKLYANLKGMLENEFSQLDCRLIEGSIRQVISASDVVLAASGTVTLETALVGRPFVMAYKVSKLSELMFRCLGQVDYFSMPNFLLEKPEVPEFVQRRATVENLSQALKHYLDDKESRLDIRTKFTAIKTSLDIDSDEIAADVICKVLARGQVK